MPCGIRFAYSGRLCSVRTCTLCQEQSDDSLRIRETFTQHIVNYPELSSVVDTIVYNSYVGELKVNLRLIKTVGLSELGRRVSISGL